MSAKSAQRVEFLADVLIAAVEGGTGYWAAVSGYKHTPADEAQVTFWVEDEPERQGEFVGLEGIARGIGRIAKDEFEINPELRKLILAASRENDAGDIDADAADVIVQAAIFGEIVYG